MSTISITQHASMRCYGRDSLFTSSYPSQQRNTNGNTTTSSAVQHQNQTPPSSRSGRPPQPRKHLTAQLSPLLLLHSARGGGDAAFDSRKTSHRIGIIIEFLGQKQTVNRVQRPRAFAFFFLTSVLLREMDRYRELRARNARV